MQVRENAGVSAKSLKNMDDIFSGRSIRINELRVKSIFFNNLALGAFYVFQKIFNKKSAISIDRLDEELSQEALIFVVPFIGILRAKAVLRMTSSQ